MDNLSQPKWDFTSVSDAYEKKGLNDSGVETFKDDSFKSLAREICQNSLDAKSVAQDDEKRPVIIEFHRFISSSEQFQVRIRWLMPSGELKSSGRKKE